MRRPLVFIAALVGSSAAALAAAPQTLAGVPPTLGPLDARTALEGAHEAYYANSGYSVLAGTAYLALALTLGLPETAN